MCVKALLMSIVERKFKLLYDLNDPINSNLCGVRKEERLKNNFMLTGPGKLQAMVVALTSQLFHGYR